MCPCSLETQDTEYYFCKTLANDLSYIKGAIASLNANDVVIVTLYGDEGVNKTLIARY